MEGNVKPCLSSAGYLRSAGRTFDAAASTILSVASFLKAQLPKMLLVLLLLIPIKVGAQPTGMAPISIPLQHLKSPSADEDEYDLLGILVGINGSKPRLFRFDTGSSEFNGQIDPSVAGVEPVSGNKPEMQAYGDGSYGYWQEQVKFESLSYFDPRNPSRPVAVIGGGYVAGRVLDRVLTKDYYAFKDTRVSQKPVGYHNGTPIYIDLEVRERMQNGEPGVMPPVYGIFGAGDFVGEEPYTSAIGGRTSSGYIVAANANLGRTSTPGCAPCAIVNLTPSLRSQFTALTPWGRLDYGDVRQRFPQSNANASLQYEGLYHYTISISTGGRERAVALHGPILFDTGVADFIYLSATNAFKKLKAAGFKMGSYVIGKANFKIYGFSDKLNDQAVEGVDIMRDTDADDGDGITIGLPFFQRNSIMYDLENRLTAYTPYFVSADNFSTDVTSDDANHLANVTGNAGNKGWLGLAGVLSGSGALRIGNDSVVRLTGANTYTGATIISQGAFLYLAGPGQIERSSSVVADGVFDISQKGNYVASWGVNDSEGDTTIRSLEGTGDVQLGTHRLILTATGGRFDGAITDYGHNTNLGGGLTIAGGKQVLGGHNDYTGMTVIAPGAELHVLGSLAGDVAVSGRLVVDGEIYGKVTVESGGSLSGNGKVGNVDVHEGGQSTLRY